MSISKSERNAKRPYRVEVFSPGRTVDSRSFSRLDEALLWSMQQADSTSAISCIIYTDTAVFYSVIAISETVTQIELDSLDNV